MILEFILVLASSLGLAVALRYAWWTRVRVIWLRESIFNLRDTLWDQARALDGLNDPAYLEAREVLNWNIRAADRLSLPSFMAAYMKFGRDAREALRSENSSLQEKIDRAYSELSRLTLVYLFRDTLTGRLAWGICSKMHLKDEVSDRISQWTVHDGPHVMPTF